MKRREREKRERDRKRKRNREEQKTKTQLNRESKNPQRWKEREKEGRRGNLQVEKRRWVKTRGEEEKRERGKEEKQKNKKQKKKKVFSDVKKVLNRLFGPFLFLFSVSFSSLSLLCLPLLSFPLFELSSKKTFLLLSFREISFLETKNFASLSLSLSLFQRVLNEPL